jgi:hypothetical protein
MQIVQSPKITITFNSNKRPDSVPSPDECVHFVWMLRFTRKCKESASK